MRPSCAKAAERIEVLFRVQTRGDPRHIVFDSDPDLFTAKGVRVEENFTHSKVYQQCLHSMRLSRNYFDLLFSQGHRSKQEAQLSLTNCQTLVHADVVLSRAALW